MAGNVLDVTDAMIETEILGSTLPVLIDFWAPWCPPCRAIAPTIEALAEKYAGRIKVVKINVDENTVSKLGVIRSIPTLAVWKNGQKVGEIIGRVPQEQIEAELAKHMGR